MEAGDEVERVSFARLPEDDRTCIDINGEYESETVSESNFRDTVVELRTRCRPVEDYFIECVAARSVLSQELFETVRDQVDSSVRGRFCPSQCIIRLGLHCIDTDRVMFPPAEGPLEMSCSVAFWGYGIPDDIEEFYQSLVTLRIFREVERRLTPLFGGNVFHTVHWDL
jgi:hypothetical protein